MLVKPRDIWRHLICLPIIIGVIWISTLLFSDGVKVSGVGSLIVAGSMYFILVALLLMLVMLIFTAILRRVSAALVVSAFCSLIAGVPILLLMNELVNGFWIGDTFVALVISIFCSIFVIGYEYAISRFH